MECWANLTLKACGCVRFFMPSEKYSVLILNSNNASFFLIGSKYTNICFNIACPRNALKNMLTRELNSTAKDRCRCMQLCTSIDYTFEIVPQPKINDVSSYIYSKFLARTN